MKTASCAVSLFGLFFLPVCVSAALGDETKTLRTPDSCFENLPGYGFTPHYVEVDKGLRMHYVDEGPRDAAPVLLLHGQPTWSYIYRKVIPILAKAGHRVIAPDLVGYGRSDKRAATGDYTYARHVAWLTAFIKAVDIKNATLVVHDWGGLLGFQVLTLSDEGKRFSRLVVLNTSLPTGDLAKVATPQYMAGFERWRTHLLNSKDLKFAPVAESITAITLPPAEQNAYDAPFPDDSFKSGPRMMTSLIPIKPDAPGAKENQKAEEILRRFDRPVLIAFSETDRSHPGQHQRFSELFPKKVVWKDVTIKDSMHLLMEDKPEEVAGLINEFIAATGKTAEKQPATPQRRRLLQRGNASAAGGANAAKAAPLGDVKFAYKLATGPVAVENVTEVVLKDKKRNKDLPVRIYYPKEGGPFPVIVFSHGAGGSKDNYGELGMHWAGHGYVVIHPSHADSIALRRATGQAADFRSAIAEGVRSPEAWANRPRDVSFLLDSLAELEKQSPALKGKMDATRIGVGGHSLGAYTAQLLGGALVDFPNQPKGQSLADPRVKAVVLLSAQGKNQQGLTETSWSQYKTPMLNVTGSNDRGAGGQGPDWKKEPYEKSPAGDKYQLFIERAHHGLGGIARQTGGPLENPEHRNYVKIATLAFWDAYLKGDSTAKAYLQSDKLESYGPKNLQFSRK